MNNLESIGLDPTGHGFISADILTAGKLSLLYQYAKDMEELWEIEYPSYVDVPSGIIAEFEEAKKAAEAWEKVLPPGCDGK